jgi:hypothetical protein
MNYVISKSGSPLMPTKRHGWVRKSLQNGKAKAKQEQRKSPLIFEAIPGIQSQQRPGV